jgi:hypothetical protein
MSAAASGVNPAFTNGPLVARKMETHYNGADYKQRLRPIRLVSRVLCGATYPWLVECSARMRAQRESNNAWVTVHTTWELTKLGRTRAKLRWTVEGPNVFQSSSEIVTPRHYGLRSF